MSVLRLTGELSAIPEPKDITLFTKNKQGNKNKNHERMYPPNLETKLQEKAYETPLISSLGKQCATVITTSPGSTNPRAILSILF